MMKNKLRLFACVLLAAMALTAFAALSGGAGSQGDPLVTLSYLNETFTKEILDKVDKAARERDAAVLEEADRLIVQAERELRGSVSEASPAYAAVTLSPGQTLSGSAGCELILRSGEAICTAGGYPGLVDTTTGGALGGGEALAENHLYLMTDKRGVSASSEAVLLVRGSYSVG
ncbi:MAG: hypothetical protein HFF68_02425 [Oscillospiraceae bacterium]|nr:hypothetical protein [Oscillospiraceae bacterium]MCI9316739.1 hypothetical protein [Oscillospiraceae bacterium]